jgi:hypothetical protein
MSKDSAPYGYFPGTGIPRKRPADAHDRRVSCDACGATGLVWEKQNEGWKLMTVGGRRHVCPKVEQAKQ